jgi:hypothetical protein
MDAGINNVIYMELFSGPKMANGICGKTIDTGTIDRGSTVYDILALWDGNVKEMWLMMFHRCLDAKSDPDFYCHMYDSSIHYMAFTHSDPLQTCGLLVQ